MGHLIIILVGQYKAIQSSTRQVTDSLSFYCSLMLFNILVTWVSFVGQPLIPLGLFYLLWYCSGSRTTSFLPKQKISLLYTTILHLLCRMRSLTHHNIIIILLKFFVLIEPIYIHYIIDSIKSVFSPSKKFKLKYKGVSLYLIFQWC